MCIYNSVGCLDFEFHLWPLCKVELNSSKHPLNPNSQISFLLHALLCFFIVDTYIICILQLFFDIPFIYFLQNFLGKKEALLPLNY